MDETDTPQNRSNDDAESKSSDENSFIGKMKFGVSKILPNSLSKWLSPKVDATTARRRRHDEIDSDDENANRTSSPLVSTLDERYQATPQLGAPPPNKKKKTFTDFLSRNTPDLYSPSVTSLIGERGSSNIVSSTLIEEVPHRSNNQFNRYLPLENGQHVAEESTRDNASTYPDEASSSQSREKPTNIFAINNDSSVVNFSAHLQRAKSLFTNRSYISPRLKNYRMRNPRSSLYRSTSSLCDNNSVSSNASSAMSSPFYNGQTTYGGASATSRRMNTTVNQDLQLHHRPKVPTNLVTSRSTSSLNNIGGSASMSNTAKRILDVMSKYNTPLTEVRRISNALPSIAEASALTKRKSILELDTSANEIDKSKRSLMKPNTPYNRPFGRNPVESVLTTELHVPSMPELLQLKKFAANTMKIRDIASNSDSVLNKPAPAKTNEFKLTKTTITNRTERDLDASNNNKSINSKIDSISHLAGDANKQHKNKIRSNLTKRKMGKCADDDLMPEPVNLPNIPLMMDKKAEPFKLHNTDQKTTNPLDNGFQIPFKFKSSNTNTPVASSFKEKQTNGNASEINKKFEISPPKPSIFAQTNSFSARSSSSCVDSPVNPPTVQNNSKPTPTTPTTTFVYRFTEPIVIQQSPKSFDTNQYNKLGRKSDYSFSQPMFLADMLGDSPKTDVPKSFSNFKFESKPINKSSDSGIDTSFKSSTAKPNAPSRNDNRFNAGKTVSSLSTTINDDDSFKSLVTKQKQGKWSCKDCLASNDATINKCACCGAANPSAKASTEFASGDIFKSIVAKQKQSKWECNDCMAHNDQAQSKCVCCGAANPNATASASATKEAEPPKPTFSFGAPPPSTAPSSAAAASQPIDNEFKKIVDKQKTSWECSACLSRNDSSKSKCACCEQSREVTQGATASQAAPAKSQLSFGTAVSAPESTFLFGSVSSTTKSVAPSFSFGNLAAKANTSTSFSFGNKKSDETKPTTSSNVKPDENKAKESTQPTSSSAQFAFGSPAILPSTSKVETITKPAAAAALPPPVASDNMFKSIVDKQKSSTWECSACMTKNTNDKDKCVCCEMAKDGSAAKESPKKDFGLTTNQKFSFGAPPSNTFSFGSQPDSKPASSGFNFGSQADTKPTFQFGSSSSSTSTATTTAAATVVVSSTSSSTTTTTFGSSSQKPMFPFSANKPTSEAAAVAPASGFQFAFGSPAAPASSSKEVSKDVTDTGPTSNTNDKGITILGNVLVKPAANGPTETPKPMFGFGGSVTNQTDDDHATKAKKRSNTDLSDSSVSAKLPAPSSASNASFIFGQPAQNTNNIFGAIVSSPATSTTHESNAPKPTFSFGANKPASNPFPTTQPAFSSTPFSFGNSSTATTTAPSVFGAAAPAPPANAPSQPIFGSNAFSSTSSSLPTLGGFKAGPTFGSTAPAFGAPTPNTEAQVQAQATPGIFQFGSSNTNTSAPLSGDQSNAGGFNFSLNTAPTFNFSEQAPAQPNVPFQFGTASEAGPNLFSVQPTASATAIQQRRKLRPVRRVNRT